MFNRLDLGRLSFAIESLSRWPATAVSCLSPRECDRMASLADKLVYLSATPMIGAKDAPVHQDFELNYSVPLDHPFWTLAKAFGRLAALALTQTGAEIASPDSYEINDLIVQRYPAGCKGITPHRDHLKYRMIVAILLVSGDGEFRIHKRRDESNGAVIRFNPGDLLLMGAPGVFPGFVRPFHSVTAVTRVRRTIGMRYDGRIIQPEG